MSTSTFNIYLDYEILVGEMVACSALSATIELSEMNEVENKL